jgi:hypothetical protein
MNADEYRFGSDGKFESVFNGALRLLLIREPGG